ncbi:MAG: hypothetical protein AAF253_12160 [Pseudomonadota bacterium]
MTLKFARDAARAGAPAGWWAALALLAVMLVLVLVPAASGQATSIDGKPGALDDPSGLSETEARNALARADYLPNLIGFGIALKNRDAAAIPHYQAAGFVLSGNTVRNYVKPIYVHDDQFDPAVAELLLAGGVDRQAFCLDPTGGWDHFTVWGRGLQHEAERLAFIRGLCGDADTVRAIRALLETEGLWLSAQSLANQSRPDVIDACMADYARANPMEIAVAEAAEFSLFSVARVTPPHDTVMMELSSWHMAGQQVDVEAAYAKAVENGCDAATPAHVVSTATYEKLTGVLGLLSPEYAVLPAHRLAGLEVEDEEEG